MGKKRSNAEGTIFYRESRKRWEAAVVVGWKEDTGPDGTQVRRPVRRTLTAKTRREVEARLREYQDNRAEGLETPGRSSTIERYAEWWLAEVLPHEGKAAATEQWYARCLRDYVVPHVGHRTLTGPQALTVGDVETMLGKLSRYSVSTRRGARVVLGKMLRSAERRGLVTRNVARLAPIPGDSGKRREVKALTPPQVGAMLTALDGSRWHVVALVGVTTGLRPAELLALHWSDTHLGKQPYVSVRYAFSWVPGRPYELKAPKRERSYRTVPLVPEAVTALKAWKKQQAAERLAAGELWDSDFPGLVFTTSGGRPYRGDVYGHTLRSALRAASPHKLRHTYATHLVEAGTPIAHVAELLGDTVAVVENTYAHVLQPKHEVASVARGILG